MAFYALDRSNTVRTPGCSTEDEAIREALITMGKIKRASVEQMSFDQVRQMLRALGRTGVRVIWSDAQQSRGQKFKAKT